MHLRWSPDAADDLEAIVLHIREASPDTARRIALELYAGIGRLTEYPQMGRPGRVAGTRELALPGMPWLAIYRVSGEVIEIVRVLHGRQRWP